MKWRNSGLFERICAWLSTSSGAVAGGVIIIMMLTIGVDVTGRYLFGSPLRGSVELNRSLLVAAVFFGLSYTQLHGGHIRVDVVVSRLPSRLQPILESFGLLVAFVVFTAMAYMTIPVTIRSIIIGEYETGLIPFPMWPGRLLLTLGLFIFVLQLAADIKAKLPRCRRKNLTGPTS